MTARQAEWSTGAVLTLKEASALCRVSRQRFMRWVRDGLGPAPMNPHERYKRWSRAEFDAWVRDGGMRRALERVAKG